MKLFKKDVKNKIKIIIYIEWPVQRLRLRIMRKIYYRKVEKNHKLWWLKYEEMSQFLH